MKRCYWVKWNLGGKMKRNYWITWFSMKLLLAEIGIWDDIVWAKRGKYQIRSCTDGAIQHTASTAWSSAIRAISLALHWWFDQWLLLARTFSEMIVLTDEAHWTDAVKLTLMIYYRPLVRSSLREALLGAVSWNDRSIDKAHWSALLWSLHWWYMIDHSLLLGAISLPYNGDSTHWWCSLAWSAAIGQIIEM